MTDPPGRPDDAPVASDGRADDHDAWVGRTDRSSEVISVTPARALLATLDRDPDSIGRSDPLPPLFHWLYGRELTRQSQLDADGHQKKGDFLPPIPYPRRMWAGGRLTFRGDVLIGDEIDRTSTIRNVAHKEGRSGPLLLITVEHRITGSGGEIVDEQDLVFLPRPSAPLELSPDPAPDMPSDWTERVRPSSAMLFRFSALTFNAHRIHYDRAWARDVELYPDLVVHGPLTAVLLADLAARRTGRKLATFSFRARRPMFVDRSITLEGHADDSGAAVRALDDTGAVAMTGEATFA